MRESHEVVLEPGWTLDKSRTCTRFLMVADLLGCVLVLFFYCSWFHNALVLCGFSREICSWFHDMVHEIKYVPIPASYVQNLDIFVIKYK